MKLYVYVHLYVRVGNNQAFLQILESIRTCCVTDDRRPVQQTEVKQGTCALSQPGTATRARCHRSLLRPGGIRVATLPLSAHTEALGVTLSSLLVWL